MAALARSPIFLVTGSALQHFHCATRSKNRKAAYRFPAYRISSPPHFPRRPLVAWLHEAFSNPRQHAYKRIDYFATMLHNNGHALYLQQYCKK